MELHLKFFQEITLRTRVLQEGHWFKLLKQREKRRQVLLAAHPASWPMYYQLLPSRSGSLPEARGLGQGMAERPGVGGGVKRCRTREASVPGRARIGPSGGSPPCLPRPAQGTVRRPGRRHRPEVVRGKEGNSGRLRRAAPGRTEGAERVRG